MKRKLEIDKKRKFEEIKRIHSDLKREKIFYYDYRLIDYINSKYHVYLYF